MRINSIAMKEQKKEKEQVVEKKTDVTYILNDALNKYKGTESPKLKEVREKFSKGFIIHR
jgi:hypothetical protein